MALKALACFMVFYADSPKRNRSTANCLGQMPTGQTKQVTDDKCEGKNQGENIRKHLTHHVKPNNSGFLIKGSLDEKLPSYELLKMLKIQ